MNSGGYWGPFLPSPRLKPLLWTLTEYAITEELYSNIRTSCTSLYLNTIQMHIFCVVVKSFYLITLWFSWENGRPGTSCVTLIVPRLEGPQPLRYNSERRELLWELVRVPSSHSSSVDVGVLSFVKRIIHVSYLHHTHKDAACVPVKIINVMLTCLPHNGNTRSCF